MAADLDEVRKSLFNVWSGDDYYLLKYFPPSSGKANEATELISEFRDNEKAAIADVTGLMVVAFEQMESTLQNDHQARYLVSCPRDVIDQPNEPVERICEALDARFEWLTHLPHALRRTGSPRETLPAGQSPGYDDHFRTIDYGGPEIDLTNESVLMLDDMMNRGETAKACRTIIMNATGCAKALGIYVGRTQQA